MEHKRKMRGGAKGKAPPLKGMELTFGQQPTKDADSATQHEKTSSQQQNRSANNSTRNSADPSNHLSDNRAELRQQSRHARCSSLLSSILSTIFQTMFHMEHQRLTKNESTKAISCREIKSSKTEETTVQTATLKEEAERPKSESKEVTMIKTPKK